ncbi:hypothetical protein EGR_01381 [Echinococcus granulosus]|uniref:Uncharacterized protein n=1 Tax=Echinococcus granulosus TaxID=6210 RepID=W6URB0_ECHGR|nr:hypothetical protein EGR_01381 [Echinococcus granulosus]EUB63758.1 hypothetical protein EGR_01381 [Echinococcus granulosus]
MFKWFNQFHLKESTPTQSVNLLGRKHLQVPQKAEKVPKMTEALHSVLRIICALNNHSILKKLKISRKSLTK